MIWKDKRTANYNAVHDTYVIKKYRGLWEQSAAPSSAWDNLEGFPEEVMPEMRSSPEDKGGG